MANPRQNSTNPQILAKIVIPKMNLEIYFDKGDSSPRALAARLAICPMNVLSPVIMTIPLPEPSLFNVEKNATFFVSSILSLSVHYIVRANSYVSPVREELSTFMPFDWTILMSAGIFLPSSITIKSPLTSSAGSQLLCFPSLITIV